jgi:hypothetical protein
MIMAFTNSPLVTYKNLTKDFSTRNGKIDTITIHCYVGQVTAKEGCDYFVTSNRKVSSNYVVGKDGSIGLSVEEKNRAWTSGGIDKKTGKPIEVNGISGADNDHRAVTIEVACDTKKPYAVTDEAYNALIQLVADICKRNNIKELKWNADKSLVGQVDKQNMTVHRWFASTECPGDWLYSHMDDIAAKVNAILKPKKTPTKKPSKPKAKFAKGDKVTVKKAVTYDGKSFKTYYDVYDVIDIKGDKVVIGVNGTVTAAVKDENLTKAASTSTAKKEIKVGSTVKVKKGAKTFNGGHLASFVYERNHKVKEVNVDRVVITYNGIVIAAVRKSDLTVID